MRSGLLFSLLLFSHQALAFTNPALQREIANLQNPVDYRLELELTAAKCRQSPNLRRINTPVDHGDPRSKMMTYWYEMVPAATKTDRTIVVLPGGPGVKSIGNQGRPTDFRYVQIDPRGLGCNFGTAREFPPGTMSTRQHALDVLAVLKKEGLKNYVVHGHSYGTVVATQLGAFIHGAGVTEPRAVVLEGTFDRAIGSWAETLAPVAALIQARTVPEVLNHLRVLGLDRETQNFVGWILERAYASRKASSVHLLELRDLILDTHSGRELEEIFAAELAAWRSTPYYAAPDPSDFVSQTIICGELMKSDERGRYKIELYRNRFDVVSRPNFGSDRCAGAMFQPYDSAQFQVRAPIYYFQGALDVSTPEPWARAHFDRQTQASFKHFVLAKESGHEPFPRYPWNSSPACTVAAYSAIFDRSRDLSAVIDENGRCRQ